MAGIKVEYVMRTTEVDQYTLTRDEIILGWGELDPGPSLSTPTGFMLRQVPGHLHDIADRLEDGMTSGPDEATWLGRPGEQGQAP